MFPFAVISAPVGMFPWSLLFGYSLSLKFNVSASSTPPTFFMAACHFRSSQEHSLTSFCEVAGVKLQEPGQQGWSVQVFLLIEKPKVWLSLGQITLLMNSLLSEIVKWCKLWRLTLARVAMAGP